MIDKWMSRFSEHAGVGGRTGDRKEGPRVKGHSVERIIQHGDVLRLTLTPIAKCYGDQSNGFVIYTASIKYMNSTIYKAQIPLVNKR